jgi:hypothetical protein
VFTRILVLIACIGACDIAFADLYECIDKDGNRRFTNVKLNDASCTLINRSPVTSARTIERPQLDRAPASSETVFVKYRGPVDLTPFRCASVTRSSLLRRVCYDGREQYMLVDLNGVYYHYCEVPQSIVTAFTMADSMGRYYNAVIKGRFDCRVYRMPSYN